MSATQSQIASDNPVDFDPFSDDFFNGAFDTYRRLRDSAPSITTQSGTFGP